MLTHVCPVCHSRKLRRRVNLYLECADCSSYYLRRMAPDSFIRKKIRLYGKTFTHEAKNEKLARVAQKRLRDISLFVKSDARLLDVGSGMGQFVQYARRWGYNVAAMDKAVPCVRYLRKMGIPSYTSLKRIRNHSCDAVTLFDVIEHIKRPYPFLLEIRKKLKANGTLMVTTPNARGISSRIIPTLLTWARVRYSEHATLHTTRSLNILLTKAGFVPIVHTTDMLLPWFTAKNSWVCRVLNKIVYLSLRPFFPLLFARDLGDNIQLIAKVSKQ